MIRLLTWLDVRRNLDKQTKFGTNLPDKFVRISCFSDAVEVVTADQEQASKKLKEWFGDWYQEDSQFIQLDFGEAILPVEFLPDENYPRIQKTIRPLWAEIAYLDQSDQDDETNSRNLPQNSLKEPSLVAFHSFKGGVGRTLHLASYIFALLEQAKKNDQSITLLVIDADLEAPGLTYLQEKQQPKISFIEFLEIYQYPPENLEKTLELFAKEVKKTPQVEGKSTLYFLPAFVEQKQLLDISILPENLVKSPQGTWEYGNAIHKLGQALGADYIFIDLRAGLSEISSPILFDPRIQRFIVTTLNRQSIQGTSLVLEQISHIAPPQQSVDNEQYYDPSLIISMLTEEQRSLPEFADALARFQSSYVQSSEDDLTSTRLEIKESKFAQELLYIKNWEQARKQLSQTSIMDLAQQWAETQLSINSPVLEVNNSKHLDSVNKLKESCQKYIYAEEGEGEDLLVTEPLNNLALEFQENLPRVVSIGAKGSGKTFTYLQLSRFQYWENFLQKVNSSENISPSETYIFPFLQSQNLKDKAMEIINSARQKISDILPSEFLHSKLVDRIKTELNHQKGPESSWSEIQWTEFWLQEIAKALGMGSQSITLQEINRYLLEKELRIILLFDGLEDVFADIATDEQEKKALKSLIQDIPNKLAEMRQANLGVIIFLRRDFLHHTITQNVQQFENLYKSYDLAWDPNSFLRLVYWLCIQAQVIDAQPSELKTLNVEEIKEKLQQLWGKRLGSDKSKEAYSASWIFAALTDFKGRLQARDIVRFIYHAAKITVEKSQEIQFEKWSTSRLLPPQAIRRALQPCSEEKVKEAKEEYPVFKNWVEQLPGFPNDLKKIPFAPEQFNMDQGTITTLELMGVIYEDKEKEESAHFYIPEIFREGLGFSAQVARPRVLALKRRVLPRGII